MVHFVDENTPITAFEAANRMETKFGQGDDQKTVANYESIARPL